jgi:hypothetical protein
MKSKACWCCFAISIFLIFLTIYIINNTNYEEGFTPRIREFYRPYIRDARFASEKHYTNTTNNIDKLFKRFGLY